MKRWKRREAGEAQERKFYIAGHDDCEEPVLRDMVDSTRDRIFEIGDIAHIAQ